MTRYCLQLINRNRTLDLRAKRSDIENVLRFIHNGGCSGRAFASLEKYKKPQINQHDIVIEVNESSNRWHPFVGFFLANRCGMRTYCAPMNKSRMFKWIKV